MPKQTKSITVRKMLERPKGATIITLCDKTGWQRHTVHAFLSRLRTSGSTIKRKGKGADAAYRITPDSGVSK